MRHSNYSNIYPILGNHEYAAATCLRFLLKEITEENQGFQTKNEICNKIPYGVKGKWLCRQSSI